MIIEIKALWRKTSWIESLRTESLAGALAELAIVNVQRVHEVMSLIAQACNVPGISVQAVCTGVVLSSRWVQCLDRQKYH